MDVRDLLQRASTHPRDSAERTLYIVAAVDVALGRSFTLIGGSAVHFYTGEYRPTDVDLAGRAGTEERRLLGDKGFVFLGPGHRHVELRLGGDVHLIEFPTSGYDIEAVLEVRLENDLKVRVISLSDLIVDRLIQATDGTLLTFEDAVSFVVAMYPEIEWPTLEERIDREAVTLPGIADMLVRVRAAAAKAMRS